MKSTVKKLAIILVISTFSQQVFALSISDCKNIHEALERLVCYDKISNYRGPLVKESKDIREPENKQVPLKRSGFAISPHKLTYFMPGSYNTNRRSNSESPETPQAERLDDLEVKFQFSFKFPLWEEVLGEGTELMTAYTQKSFWQMYNSSLSSPFRETNYTPEVYLSIFHDINFLGLKLVNSNFGFVHESNGRSNLLSRSWNRVYSDFIFSQGNFAMSIKPWLRVKEKFEDDDNPDIEDYLGHYELGFLYQWKGNEITLMLRNIEGNKHQATYRLGWLFPLNEDINMYFEYFHGYGDSLIDYNRLNETFGIGFAITDWVE